MIVYSVGKPQLCTSCRIKAIVFFDKPSQFVAKVASSIGMRFLLQPGHS